MHKTKVKYISYKIASLLLAIILWLTIKNNIDPTVRASIDLPISFINEDTVKSMGKSYNVVGPSHCTIDYIVPEKNKNQILKSDFEAYVDLSDLSKTEHLNIYINTFNNIKNIVKDINVKPKTLQVTLDDVGTEEVEVKYVLKNKLDSNHSIGYVSLSPEKVLVSGSNIKINELSHIEIEIPVNNLSDYFKGTAKVNLISKDGKKLDSSEYNLAVSEISYSVTIYSNVNVPLNQPIEGKVESGAILESVVINPPELPIQCTKSTSLKVPFIDLPLVNVNEFNETKVVEVPVKDILPAGARCDQYDKVIVTFNVIKKDGTIEPTAKAKEDIQISSVEREE